MTSQIYRSSWSKFVHLPPYCSLYSGPSLHRRALHDALRTLACMLLKCEFRPRILIKTKPKSTKYGLLCTQMCTQQWRDVMHALHKLRTLPRDQHTRLGFVLQVTINKTIDTLYVPPEGEGVDISILFVQFTGKECIFTGCH